MKYPMFTLTTTRELLSSMQAGHEISSWEPMTRWVGSGTKVDLGPIEETSSALRTAMDQAGRSPTRVTPEEIEGQHSGRVHSALDGLAIEALDDPGFWRYLSLRYFWDFIGVREAGPIARGNVMPYVDGGRECVPFRMYLRAQAIRVGDDYDLAGVLPKAADFWRSHIIRVRTGAAPALARSFVKFQAREQMPSTTVRPFAKRINRLWSNIVFDIWSEDECTELLEELYSEHRGVEADRSILES